MKFEEIIQELESLSSPEDVEGMARFGINPKKVYAVKIPELRRIAKKTGKNHALALKLWEKGYRETRILACMIEDPDLVTSEQMDEWAADFDFWEICDQCCMKLFRMTPFAYQKIFEWGKRDEEFTKRAAFTLIAVLAVHDKRAPDEKFEEFFPLIIRESTDNRNYVKKAVNWALRHIGKRNLNFNRKAIIVAEDILKIDSKSAKWIAKDALRELKSEKVQKKIGKPW
ncbi:DNA alkylation repair protein [Methanobacterium petrolearium]|uniref:DNA alkylation repair protein n=1 Tax=Methanobacterium petrolearium TaxID=710190 RepID=UPI001AE91658|nr:DNA alkylation repair protein [Methanobacterium petrolearium]MBP1945866.1 3-methyladenine DNA glycosylase AlkD [Methanobacterium petrolearium]